MIKGKDSRKVFEVFQKGSFMEGATFWEKLKWWFKNVYWFHFKLATFVVIGVVILSIVLITDLVTRKYNDIDYILAGAVFADTEQMGELSNHLAGFIDEDPNDDKTPAIGHQMLTTESIMGSGDQALVMDEYNSASIQKIGVCMADDEILLFFFDRQYAEWYAKDGAFEPLSEFGIESENGYYVRVDGLPIFKELGIVHNDGIYAGIKVKTDERMKVERIAAKYEKAGRALASLLATAE